MKKRKIVIALGGNALGKNVEEQQEAVEHTAKVIVDLEQQGYDLIITHGNGPQVGMIQSAMNEYAAAHSEAEVPLSTSVAMSQGYIGFDLQNAIKDELYLRGIDHKVSTIISQVEVDPEDPAFYHPTKPIGRFMTREEAIKKEAKGIPCVEDSGRGYRQVVASPKPKRIRELQTIRTLVNAGHIVVTCGGGGIPVVQKDGKLVGVNAAGPEAGCGISGDSNCGREGCHSFWKAGSAVVIRIDGRRSKEIHGRGRIPGRFHASQDRGSCPVC